MLNTVEYDTELVHLLFRFRNGKEITSDEHILIDTNEEGQVSSTLTIDHFTKDDIAEVSDCLRDSISEI